MEVLWRLVERRINYLDNLQGAFKKSVVVECLSAKKGRTHKRCGQQQQQVAGQRVFGCNSKEKPGQFFKKHQSTASQIFNLV